MCGIFRKGGRGFAVVSNRSSLERGADYVLEEEREDVGYECTGLSNSLIHDEWPKVKMGKELLYKLKEEDIKEHLMSADPEFRRLVEQHKSYEGKLHDLHNRHHLTEHDHLFRR